MDQIENSGTLKFFIVTITSNLRDKITSSCGSQRKNGMMRADESIEATCDFPRPEDGTALAPATGIIDGASSSVKGAISQFL